jgi:Niemann-Pick C2 protein
MCNNIKVFVIKVNNFPAEKIRKYLFEFTVGVEMAPPLSLVTVALVLGVLAPINAVKWVNCPNTKLMGTVSLVAVAGCDTTPVCILKKGQNASIEIDFVINEDSKVAKSVVHGIIAGVPFPFGLDHPDVCTESGVQCPLKSGTSYTYKTHIYVKSDYPSVSVKVRWEIQDDQGNDIVCIELPAKLSSVNSTPKQLNTNLLFQHRQL